MGMGPQPPLPHPHKDRRTLFNPLPWAHLTPPPSAPPLLLPHRNLPLDPARALPPALLEPDPRLPQRHRRLGNPTEPVPPRPRNNLHRAPALRFPQRPLAHPRNTKAHLHRRYRRSAGWEVWRYTAGRCADELCESAGRSVRQSLHVLLVQP
jgi:hypothetical protein